MCDLLPSYNYQSSLCFCVIIYHNDLDSGFECSPQTLRVWIPIRGCYCLSPGHRAILYLIIYYVMTKSPLSYGGLWIFVGEGWPSQSSPEIFWGPFYLLSSMVSYFSRFVCRINVVCHEFYILVGPFMVASKMYSWWFEWWNFIYWDQYIMVSTSKIITNIFSTVLKLWISHNIINNLTIKLHLDLDCAYGGGC